MLKPTRRKPVGIVNRALFDFLMESGHVLVVKRNLAAHQHKQNDAKAPYVNLGSGIRPCLQKLRRGKVQTAAVCLEFPILLWGEKVAETEIDNLDVASLADQDVLDLQVAMDNAVAVAIVDGAGYLAGELASLLLLELTVGNDVVQHLAAINVFEKHVPMPPCSQVIAEPANVLMVQKADDSRLTGVTVFPSGIGLFTLFPRLSAIVGRYSFDDLAGDLNTRKQR